MLDVTLKWHASLSAEVNKNANLGYVRTRVLLLSGLVGISQSCSA